MGWFSKKKTKEKNYDNYPISVELPNGKVIHVLSNSVINSENGKDLYVAEIYENYGLDDTIMYSGATPVAFELPTGRKDLIKNLIKLYSQARSDRELNTMAHTYIGNIKEHEDGKLYYHDDTPSARTQVILQKEDFIYSKNKTIQMEKERIYDETQQRRREETYRENERKLKIEMEKQDKFDAQIRKERLKKPYFKREDTIGAKEGYDFIDPSSGSIMLLRDIKKYKDEYGRYMYEAYLRKTDQETYTEYSFPVGKKIIFTTPSRLADLVDSQNNNQNSHNIVNGLQGLLALKYKEADEKGEQVIDAGGVNKDGQTIENKTLYGLTSAMINKILEIMESSKSEQRKEENSKDGMDR